MSADEWRVVGAAIGITAVLAGGIGWAWLASRRREDLGRVSEGWLRRQHESMRRAELDANHAQRPGTHTDQPRAGERLHRHVRPSHWSRGWRP